MRILLVKTSSLGDVVHNLPVVTDLRREHPGAAIDWVVEEGFADLVGLHPGVRRVIPVALRRWRRAPLAASTWREAAAFRRVLREQDYDLVIDTQGLLKSALIARLARGRRCGHGAGSAREPLAAGCYDTGHDVPRALHAVERNRRLAALCAGGDPSAPLDYGLAVPPAPTCETAYAVLLTATSRDDKLWPEDRWIALGRALAEAGLAGCLPAGSAPERERAARIARAVPGAVALPPLALADLAGGLAAARLVIGVDTGLVHLGAALGRPTLALFCASDPGLTGVLARTPAKNLGAAGRPPEVAEALAAARALL